MKDPYIGERVEFLGGFDNHSYFNTEFKIFLCVLGVSMIIVLFKTDKPCAHMKSGMYCKCTCLFQNLGARV